MKKLFILTAIICFGFQSLSAQEITKIWIVRHAEKATNNPNDKDPGLTDIGLIRAQDLNNYLQKKKVNKLYSTNFSRTKQTLQPLASAYNLDIDIYKDNNELAKKVKALQGSNNIVVAGHSNTVVKLVKDLGATIAVDTLTDDDYDFIFLVTIKGDKITVKTKNFGSKNHVTKIK